MTSRVEIVFLEDDDNKLESIIFGDQTGQQTVDEFVAANNPNSTDIRTLLMVRAMINSGNRDIQSLVKEFNFGIYFKDLVFNIPERTLRELEEKQNKRKGGN